MKYTKIKSLEQYNQYCESHEELTLDGYDKHKDELELIEILIDDYEDRTGVQSEEMNPVELLEYLMNENQISKAQLARELDVSRQLVSDIMSFRRSISKAMLIKLAERFKMKLEAFSGKYELLKSPKSALSEV